MLDEVRELFLPRCLREVYPEWANESLDGLFVARATKTGPASAVFVGTCILISDQTVTPFAVELGAIEETEHAIVVQLKLGEPGAGPLGIAGPPVNSTQAEALLASLLDRIDGVAWCYGLPLA